MCTFPAEVHKTSLCHLVSAHTGNKGPAHGLLSATFPTSLCYVAMISWFKMAPKHRTEGLPSAAKCKNAAMHLSRKMHVLHELHSGMDYSVLAMSSM